MEKSKKSVSIIGAGFTGLAAGLELSQKGYKVTIFERDEKPGGLAVGFSDKRWDWPLEKHYHHIFTSDEHILNLAKSVGVNVIFKRPITSIYFNDGIYQLDSLLSLLGFPKLSILDRIRTGLILGFLKVTPFWKPLEKITTENFLKKTMGVRSWEILWQPLFKGKFGDFMNQISASWFWARIKKRSASLGYPEGGFESLASKVAQKIEQLGGKIVYKTSVKSITKKGDVFEVSDNGKSYEFDFVISTLPTPLFVNTVQGLSSEFASSLLNLKGIGAVNLVLALKSSFLKDIYWLNINERNMPFIAVVEHTNFMDTKHYNGDKLVYVGNYLPPGHPYFKKEAEELIKEFLPYLKKINSEFDLNWIRESWVFKAPFAQPIVPLNFSKVLPPLETPIAGLFMANIQQVYPWDRGTNYAVELGEKVADLIIRTF